jgi:hypothetical protein
MAIRFTIAKRGLLPIEKTENRTTGIQEAQKDGSVTLADAASQHLTDEKWLRSLRPRLEHRPTVDAVEYQDSSSRLPSLMPKGELIAALDTLQRVMLHEMEKGNAVLLPGIGTFRLSLKGSIEVQENSDKNGAYYHGRDVHVDDILFTPDRELLEQVRRFPVDQSPYGQVFHIDDAEIDATLTELFTTHDTVTHKDVSFAFELTLTSKRVTTLLRRLVREGRLVVLGCGAQTHYRPAPGHFRR